MSAGKDKEMDRDSMKGGMEGQTDGHKNIQRDYPLCNPLFEGQGQAGSEFSHQRHTCLIDSFVYYLLCLYFYSVP